MPAHRCATFRCFPRSGNLITLVAAPALAEAAHVRIQRLLGGPALPSLGDGEWAVGRGSCSAVWPDHLLAICRSWVRCSRPPSSAAWLVRPQSSRSARCARFAPSDGQVPHRYGYIVDPGQGRQRKAQRTEMSSGLMTRRSGWPGPPRSDGDPLAVGVSAERSVSSGLTNRRRRCRLGMASFVLDDA